MSNSTSAQRRRQAGWGQVWRARTCPGRTIFSPKGIIEPYGLLHCFPRKEKKLKSIAKLWMKSQKRSSPSRSKSPTNQNRRIYKTLKLNVLLIIILLLLLLLSCFSSQFKLILRAVIKEDGFFGIDSSLIIDINRLFTFSSHPIIGQSLLSCRSCGGGSLSSPFAWSF